MLLEEGIDRLLTALPNPMRVACSGDRHWKDRDLVIRVLESLGGSKRIHAIMFGDAAGLDEIAREVATSWFGISLILDYPREWGRYHRRAGPIANSRMLRDGVPDVLLAFHDNLYRESKGTLDCVQQARKMKIPVLHIRHDGVDLTLAKQLGFDL